MPTDLAAYVHFDGNCREAMDFYAETLGATIAESSTYGDVPGGDAPEGERDWIIFARLMIGGRPIMMSDAPSQFQEKRQGFNISINVDTVEEAERTYAVLKEGGIVRMDLQETFFAKRFAMVTDRFGMPWMLTCNMGVE
jgi:PhnB protein